ncbi:MAG: hypothetical protein Q8L47_05650 [bacterium]|nr:hypothetical protein [bacterium]
MDSVLAQKSLPPEIRMWLSSISVTEKLRRISMELDIQEDELVLIPHLLFRLAVKELTASRFTETLGDWINVEPNTLNLIISEIKDGILLPISGQLRDWGVDINQIKPLVIEVRRPIVAPPPPPPPPQPKVAYIPPPPPPPAYVPPPIPAMGGRVEIGLTGGGQIEVEKVRGAIHIIGDAHEHDEKENLESRISNLEEKDVVAGSRSQSQNSPNATKEDKKIKLPISPWQTETQSEWDANKKVATSNASTPRTFIEDEHVEPLILHKETALTPVVKEQEWRQPIYPPKFPKESLDGNSLTPKVPPLQGSMNQELRIKNIEEKQKEDKSPHPPTIEQPPTVQKPQINDYVKNILEQQKVGLSSDAPSVGSEKHESGIKNIEEKQKEEKNDSPKQPVPLVGSKNQEAGIINGIKNKELRIKNVENEQEERPKFINPEPPQHNQGQEIIYPPKFPEESLAGKAPIPKNPPSQILQSKTWEGKPQPPLPTRSIQPKDKQGPNINGNTVDLR